MWVLNFKGEAEKLVTRGGIDSLRVWHTHTHTHTKNTTTITKVQVLNWLVLLEGIFFSAPDSSEEDRAMALKVKTSKLHTNLAALT